MRNAFSEFEQTQCNVKFHNSWASICKYITKEDNEPEIWGQYTMQDVLDIAKAKRQHKPVGVSKSPDLVKLIKRLKSCKDWYEIYEDLELSKMALHSYQNVRNVYEDLQVVKDMQSTPGERIVQFLNNYPEGA